MLYAVPFRSFLEVVGLPDKDAGRDSIPDRFIPRLQPGQIQVDAMEQHQDRGFLGELLRRSEDIPIFLKGAIADLSGLRSRSLGCFFWLGGVTSPLHPYLANALLVSVDGRRKRPLDSRSLPLWEQSFYVVLKRDGTYLCGPCGVENGALVMHPETEHPSLREEFRNRRDAEVVGQVCAVVRMLP